MIAQEQKKYKNIYNGNGIFGYNGKESKKERKKYGHGNKIDDNINYIKNINPSSIADIGCGHNEFIQECKKVFNIKANGVDFACPSSDIQACATSLPFKNKEYDVITSYDMLEHIPEKELPKVFKEFSRVSERFIFIICTKRSIITINEDILHICKKPPIWWVEKIVKFGSEINDINFKKGKLFIYGRWVK